MTTCFLKTSLPQLYQPRTQYPDYDMQIFADSDFNILGQTTITLKTAVKMPAPFMIIPDTSLYNTPIRFSGSPVYITNNNYYVITLYLTNIVPYQYTITTGTPIARITLLNNKFNLVIEP